MGVDGKTGWVWKLGVGKGMPDFFRSIKDNVLDNMQDGRVRPQRLSEPIRIPRLSSRSANAGMHLPHSKAARDTVSLQSRPKSSGISHILGFAEECDTSVCTPGPAPIPAVSSPLLSACRNWN